MYNYITKISIIIVITLINSVTKYVSLCAISIKFLFPILNVPLHIVCWASFNES